MRPLIPRSISGRLLLWQITGVTAILLAFGLFFYHELKEIIVSSTDRTLHAKAQIFTGLLHEEHGFVELELSDIIAGEYVIPRSGHYYRVLQGNTLLAGSPSLIDGNFIFVPAGDAPDSGGSEEHYYTATGPAGELVRVLRYYHRAFDTTFEITLAESLSDGLSMITSFRHYLLIALPLGILLLSLAAWWIIRTALTPLSRFSTTIESISYKNLDEQLHTDRITDELTRIATSFNALLIRLNLVFESQKRLVADASHELKTPLAVITTQCDVTLQRARTLEEYVETIQSIRSETKSITHLVNDLLSLARLDAGLVTASRYEQLHVCDLVAYAVRLSAPLAAERKIFVTTAIDGDLKVSCVRTALEEALLNLVENGIRYNHVGGTVAISVTANDTGELVIEVRDTGNGIDSADVEHIFERFYRAATVRNSDGSGLGLSIVKAIIEGHNGRITVDSKAGTGSCFTIYLPQ